MALSNLAMHSYVQITSIDVESLPEDQRTEGQRFTEAIAEEEKERGELLRRRMELSENISSQEKELTEIKDKVSALESKVSIYS